MSTIELKPNDYVYKIHDDGLGGDAYVMRIVRVNRLTYTCDGQNGDRGRIEKHLVCGRWRHAGKYGVFTITEADCI